MTEPKKVRIMWGRRHGAKHLVPGEFTKRQVKALHIMLNIANYYMDVEIQEERK